MCQVIPIVNVGTLGGSKIDPDLKVYVDVMQRLLASVNAERSYRGRSRNVVGRRGG